MTRLLLNKSLVVAVAAMGVSVAAFASREAILLEHPTYWYAFDNDLLERSSGSSNMSFSDKQASKVSLVAHENGVGGYLSCSDSGCPYGSGFAFGDGNWTVMMRAKAVADANRILLGLGSITAGNHGLVLHTKNANTLTLRVIENFVNFEQTLDIPVADVTAWHDYAFCFDLADKQVSVWVDGVKVNGVLPHPNYTKSSNSWQWFSMNGGLGSSGLVVGSGCAMDDFRLYQRILTQTEIAALVEGRTQVPVYGGFLAAADKTIWKNLELKDVVRFRVRHGGSSMGSLKVWSVPFYETRTTTSVIAQMQCVDDGTYNKVVKAQFTQDGDDILGKAHYSKYVQPSGSGGINATQGNDFDINPATAATIAVGNDTSGYGLHQLTADTLYDDNAAIWTAGDGTLSTAANWRDSDAVAAGRPLSFVTGTGTVENDFPAGTAFGTLAMGVESGDRTVSGNAATFAEVLNASTSALTFTAPLTYEGDFKPYSLGPITFTALNVGGTFQPIGSGDIIFAGESHIAKADIRYHVKTDDRGVYAVGGSGWSTYSGYLSNNKHLYYVLRTLPSGTTYIDELLQCQAGQRRQTTVLDGNFVLGGNPLPGSDAILAIDNGATTFLNFYQPNSTIGINAFVYVHENGTLNLPGINSSTAVYMYIDGTVNAGDASAATTLNLESITDAGTGTFNARLLGGSAITAKGVTIGPEGALLAIPTAITLSQNTDGPGVTFRTSSPEGSPAVVSMSAALTPGSVPLAITGGGSFIYQNATALTLADLSVAANTTADLSAPASVTLTASALAAGAKLILPFSATFTAKPTLPAEGTATISFKPGASAANTYSLGGTDWTDADLDHLAVTLEGTRAAQYTAALSVVDGALKVTLTDANVTTGAKSASLFARGYTGATTLTQFPALIKLPTQVNSFRYVESTNDGSDLWFADANGNRIPHEIETWDPNGESLVWVRVPSLVYGTEIQVHWGDTASVPALADTKTFNTDYLGVWHFADTSWKDSSPNALVGGKVGSPQISDAKIGKGFYNASGANRFETANNSKWLEYANTHQLSVSCWIKNDNSTANLRIVSCKTTWSSAGGFEITTRGTANNEIRVGCNNSAQYSATSTPNYKSGWVHIVSVYDGTLATPASRTYVNGVLRGSATGADYNPKTKSDALAIGGTPNSSNNPFVGRIDEVRMTKTILSEDWIQAEYANADSPTTFFTEQASNYFVVDGNTYETVAPTIGTTEYAGTHVLAFSYPTTPLVISGDVSETAEYGMFQFYDAPVTVKEGGTLTLTRNVRFGEYNTLTAGHTLGAHLIIEGGLVQAPSGSLDYSGYNSVDLGTDGVVRPQVIDMTGGKFTVTMKGWQRATDHDAPNNEVNVGGTAEFAPDAFGWRNTVSGYQHTFHWYVTMDGTGRFTLPVSGVPDVVHVDVAGGTPSLGAADEAYFSGTLELAAGKTLGIATGTVINTGVITGTGTLTVENGAVLDLTESASNTANFTGAVTVKNGGTLILPADKTPTYAISLEAGAHVIATVTETPGNTPPFLGALAAVPNAGTATIEFDLPASMPQGSAYTLTTSQLPAGSADHLVIAFTGAAGDTTQGVVELGDDGEVIARITESAAKGALEWKGSDFAGNSWWQYGSEDATLYPFFPNVALWFTDRGTSSVVTVPSEVKSDVVTFNSANDYDLRGAKIEATSVVKDGTGTLLLNGNGFTTEDLTVKAGTLKLGDAATKNILGSNTATLTIEDGATLDLNTRLTASGDTNRGAVLNDSIVVITGDGEDGAGAVIDANPSPTVWGFNFGRIQLSGDATIGGTSRIDLRKASTSTFAGRCWLRGGADDTLTIKTHVAESTNCGFDFNTADVEIGKIVLDEGGMIGYEGDTALNVPKGIEMKSGSRIHYWNAAGHKAPIVVTGTGAGIKSSSADANTQDEPVTVQGGASLDLRGETKLTFSAAVTNEGAITISASTHEFDGAIHNNNGSFVQSGGTSLFNPTAYTAPFAFSQSGGTSHFGSKADCSGTSATLAMTAGSLWWGMGEATGFPAFGSLTASGTTAGTIYFHSGKSDTIPAAFAGITAAEVRVYNAADDQVTTLPAGNYTVSSTLSIGNHNYPAHLKLASGANVTTKDLIIAREGESPKQAILEVGPGSALTVTGTLRNSEWSRPSEYLHEIIVNGGTINATANNVGVAYDSPLGYLTLTDGLLNVKGLAVRERWGSYIYDNSDERFTMTGGELRLGSGGITTARLRYDATQADLAAGTYKATANHSLGKYGMIVATGETLGAEQGEGLTLDLNGCTVNHSYSPHFGGSDVTIVGNGTYTTSSDWQGIVEGKWTVDTAASAAVNFSGFSGFAKGLELKPNTSVDLGISDGTVEYAYLAMRIDAAYEHVSTNGPMPSVASHLKKMGLYYASGKAPVNSCSFATRGQFYVPEDDAGLWTFAGTYDDNIGLWIDGNQVIKVADWQHITRGTHTLTAGWHDFIYIVDDGTGAQGVYVSDWQTKGMSLGWCKGESSSSAAADYNRFDTSTLRMRIKPQTGCEGVTLYKSSAYSTHSTQAALAGDDIVWTLDSENISMKDILNTKNAKQQTTLLKFEGGFLVDEDHEGEWTFNCSWDDRIQMNIDGQRVVDNAESWQNLGVGTATLKAGWHWFEIRTEDGGGGYGTDAKGVNGGMAMAVKRPGDAEKVAFDERNICFTRKAMVAQKAEKAGLGGESVVGAGAELRNGAPWSGDNLVGRYCPIYGSISGAGTLSGAFRFTGNDNCWGVKADYHRVTEKLTFNNPDANTLAGLKKIHVDFTERPTTEYFELADALGLTAADAEGIVVEAPIPEALRKASDGAATDFEFTAVIKGGKLCLKNGHPKNGTVIFVR